MSARLSKRVAVVIASVGRPELLGECIRALGEQALRPVLIVVSVPTAESLPPDLEACSVVPIEVVLGSRGASSQRNAGITRVPEDVDFIAFVDDDAFLREDYLSGAVEVFASEEGVVGLTGRVIRDGAAEGRPIPRGEALQWLDRSRSKPTNAFTEVRSLYGCNMVIERKAVGHHQFDERLKLYSWLEDLDLSARLSRVGRLIRVDDCVAVHLGSSSGGRTQHQRLGYSQVTNPVYLWRKGSVSAGLATKLIFRPMTRNVVAAFVGQSASWRRDRLRGNLMSILDLLSGHITPERIEEMG